MKRRLVLLDIDGTILLSAGAGKRAIHAALAPEVRDPAAFEGIRFDGKTDPQIVTEMLTRAGQPAPTRERIELLCIRYAGLLEAELALNGHRTRVLPGVAALLDRLESESSVVLGLLTGNIARGAELKLRAAGIERSRFAVGAFGSDAADRPELPPIAVGRAEPHFGRRPAGEEIVIIGDTPADVTCGRSVGARAIAVATGSYSTTDLSAAGAFAVFRDLGETDLVMEAILR
jgi:phosphoglycolate phosphatase-like HAD superfamily hydrolase